MYSSFFVEGFNEYLDKKSVVYSVLLIGQCDGFVKLFY